MTAQDFADRVASWFGLVVPATLRRNRLLLETIVAGAYVLIFAIAIGLTYWASVIAIAAVLFLGFTLMTYRIQPFLALCAGGVGTLLMIASGFYFETGAAAVFLPLLAVFFGAAAYGRQPTRWVALAGTIPAGVAVVSTGIALPLNPISGYILFLLALALLVLAWVAGMLVYVNRGRRRAQTGEIVATVKLGEATQVATLEQERNRVARDVHDIVAHSLAVVIAQADGARYSAKAVPAPVVEALENIAATARGALTDVRVLLGELRHNQEAGPQPGMNDLDSLVRGFRDSGLVIDWTSYGTATPLGDSAALAVYRIVQEGLTNALRHGERSAPVEMIFDWGASSLAVTITNAIPAGTTPQAAGLGHGIPGMRERAHLAGGELESGAGTNGRFRVRATIPFTRQAVTA